MRQFSNHPDSVRSRKLRAKYVAKGLCSQCGQRPPATSVTKCQPCIDKYKARIAAHPPEYFERRKAKSSARHALNRDRYNAQNRANRLKIKLSVLAHYGGICACCSETRHEFLCIDHVNGGGNAHRRTLKQSFHRWLRDNNFPVGFRVLCHNCNFSLSAYGYCPHAEAASKAA